MRRKFLFLIAGLMMATAALRGVTVTADLFTGTNGTALSAHPSTTGGHVWVEHPDWNGPDINTNAVYATANFAAAYVDQGLSSPDYDVSATFTLDTAGNNECSYLIARYNVSTFDSYLAGYVESLVPPRWVIRVYSGGGTFDSPVGTYNQTLTPAQAYAYKLQLRGNSLKLYVDGVERISVTDSTYTAAGMTGLFVCRTYGHTDNFLVADLLDPPSARLRRNHR